MIRNAAIIAIAVAAAGYIFSSCGTVTHVAKLGLKQASFVVKRRPVEEVLRSGSLGEKEKEKLRLILEVKEYGEDVIGLARSRNYTMFVRVDGDALAYVLTAAYKDRLEAVRWWFPVVGSFPYLGFFDRKALEKERERLEERGFDTFVERMAAYSTLGWFLDPVFSTYLNMEDHELARMILHEMVHRTIFLRGKTSFNEQLATYVGAVGAIDFLEQKFGDDSPQKRAAIDLWHDDMLFARFVDRLAAELKALYAVEMPREEKLRRREEIFLRYREKFAALLPRFRTGSYRWFLRVELNNAVIIAVMTYHDRMELFERAQKAAGGGLRDLMRLVLAVCPGAPDPFRALEEAIAPA